MTNFLLILMTLLGAPSASEVDVTIESPPPPAKFRSVSPAEVRSVYERIMGIAPASKPAEATPAPDGQFVPLEFQPKIPGQDQKAVRMEAAAPKSAAVPRWNAKWVEKRMFKDEGVQLEIDYSWKEMTTALELRSRDAAVPSIRLLLNNPGTELLTAWPGSAYDLLISSRLPGEAVWTLLYRFENQSFKNGYSYRLVFPRTNQGDIQKFLKTQAEARNKAAKQTPAVEVNATPVPPPGN